ncbi:MAG: nucleotidyltransferase family protein [Gemmatimonadota bacterium]
MRIDQEGLAQLCHRHGITKLRLFGSLAREEGDEASDVDLLVDFEQRKSLLDLVRIERELSEHFGREVDLLTERALSPYLRDRIVREARVVYERAA